MNGGQPICSFPDVSSELVVLVAGALQSPRHVLLAMRTRSSVNRDRMKNRWPALFSLILVCQAIPSLGQNAAPPRRPDMASDCADSITRIRVPTIARPYPSGEWDDLLHLASRM